jgi:hypothetical protein
VTSEEEFVEFAAAAAPRLRRTAFLLCGNWHTAPGRRDRRRDRVMTMNQIG